MVPPEGAAAVAPTGDVAEDTVLTAHPLDNCVPAASLPKRKSPGKNQGRYRAADYTGCTEVTVHHDTLSAHGLCPDCAAQEQVGKLYPTEPGVLIRLQGQPLIGGTRYTIEKLRCNTCQKIYAAPLPSEVVNRPKYDAGCLSNIAMARYYLGVPFKRLELWQAIQGVPVADATQWDKMKSLWTIVQPVCLELEALAAEGQGMYFDDTPGKILHLAPAHVTGLPTRKGIYTTAVVSEVNGHSIYLFYTSQCYGGENIRALLSQRQSQDAFFTMCDAHPLNIAKDLDATLRARWLICFCLVHGRRNFFELLGVHDSACDFVLKVIGTVYLHEKHCKTQGLTPEERLAYHRKHSMPLMDALWAWLNNQQLFKQIEPNSRLGKAIRYMLKHWERLTQFLRHPGVPLDDSLGEQTIKVVIRHRRNSLFYRTSRGAKVGDNLMGLIHTAARAGVNVLDYLNALQQHATLVSESPALWLPWTYQQTLRSLALRQAA